MTRKQHKDLDGPDWLEAYRNGPKGTWLVASAARGETVYVDQTYPHVHGLEVPGAEPIDGRIPRYSREQCLACAGADAPTKPREWVIPADPQYSTAADGREWRFGCLLCGVLGTADSEANSHGQLNLHLIEACPATAWDEAEFRHRQVVREVLIRLYPDVVPPYTKPYRPHPWCEHE